MAADTDSALRQFTTNIGRARDLCGLAMAIEAQTTPVVDTSDVLRASLVLAVSALDHYIHEVTRLGMLEIASGCRPTTDAYLRYRVSLRSAAAAQGSSGLQWLDQEIRSREAWQSYQDPDRIADAVRRVTAKPLWPEVGRHLGLDSRDARRRLKLVVERRNKIAHEADLDPSAPGFRWPISRVLVEDALEFLGGVARGIAAVVRRD